MLLSTIPCASGTNLSLINCIIADQLQVAKRHFYKFKYNRFQSSRLCSLLIELLFTFRQEQIFLKTIRLCFARFHKVFFKNMYHSVPTISFSVAIRSKHICNPLRYLLRTKNFAYETLAASAVACDTLYLRASVHPARKALYCIGITSYFPIQYKSGTTCLRGTWYLGTTQQLFQEYTHSKVSGFSYTFIKIPEFL